MKFKYVTKIRFVSGWSGVQIPPPAPPLSQSKIGLERTEAHSCAIGRRSHGYFEWRRAEVGSRGYHQGAQRVLDAIKHYLPVHQRSIVHAWIAEDVSLDVSIPQFPAKNDPSYAALWGHFFMPRH
jgi:hypothetical protein